VKKSMEVTGASAVEVVGQLQPPPQESADRLPSSLAG
jgi:1-acyl-sn-glycerol-3-phosphate acyltransferase